MSRGSCANESLERRVRGVPKNCDVGRQDFSTMFGRPGYIGQFGPFWVPLDRFERLWLKNAVSQLVMWKTATRVSNIWILGTCSEYLFLKKHHYSQESRHNSVSNFFQDTLWVDGARGKHFSRGWSRWLQCARAEEGRERAVVVVYEYQRKIGEPCKSLHNCDSAAPEKVQCGGELS